MGYQSRSAGEVLAEIKSRPLYNTVDRNDLPYCAGLAGLCLEFDYVVSQRLNSFDREKFDLRTELRCALQDLGFGAFVDIPEKIEVPEEALRFACTQLFTGAALSDLVKQRLQEVCDENVRVLEDDAPHFD